MTDKFYKLARPLMRGVKVEVSKMDFQNRMVRDLLNGMPNFVGEIVIGKPEDPECHDMTALFLDTPDIIHPFIFWVYDMHTSGNYGLRDRLKIAEPMVVGATGPYIQFVDHELVETKEQLDAYAKKVVEKGFPGIVLREPFGTYGTHDEEIEAAALGTATQ